MEWRIVFNHIRIREGKIEEWKEVILRRHVFGLWELELENTKCTC